MQRVTQCCACYRVQAEEEGQKVWKKARDAAALSRCSKLTFCPECELKFRARWGLLTEQHSAARKAA